MDEGGGLEIRYGGNSIGGSNPFLSAIFARRLCRRAKMAEQLSNTAGVGKDHEAV